MDQGTSTLEEVSNVSAYTPHPDDLEMLLKIRRYLIGYRITNGWTQEELSARINETGRSAERLENGPFDWTLTRLQMWPVPFGLKLHATPCFHERPAGTSETWEEIIEADPMVSAFRTAMHETKQWQAWQRMYLTSYLKVAREVQDISTAELGARMGITSGAVNKLELHGDNVKLIRMLNHARALGGTIRLEVS